MGGWWNPFKSAPAEKTTPPPPEMPVAPSSSALDTTTDLRKYATIHQGIFASQGEEMRRRAEQEGLVMSQRRRLELCDQWKFYLFSDPIQRGIDFGLVSGGVVGVGSCYWPQNRIPHRFLFFFSAGFALGMMGVPMMIMYHNASNDNKRRLREKHMMARQREQFLKNQIES